MQNHTILASRLSMDSDIPLYTQLVGIIKQNISSGELNVGDLLPSEAELCRTMGISRNTVRQAIGELEEEGLVVRKRGKGTFVADPNARGKCVRYSFTTRSPPWARCPHPPWWISASLCRPRRSAAKCSFRRASRCTASPVCVMLMENR